MLRVKKLNPNAILPTTAHPGSDLGYDLYALKDTVLIPGKVTAVETGISARFTHMNALRKFGLVIKDRSSMAAKGITTSAGVIDAGYTGEIKVLMTNNNPDHKFETSALYNKGYLIKAGDKIAQMYPSEIFTGTGIAEVGDLGQTDRGAGGFGSTGA